MSLQFRDTAVDGSWQHYSLCHFRHLDVTAACLISLSMHLHKIALILVASAPSTLISLTATSSCLFPTPVPHPSLISYPHFSPSRNLILFLFHSPYFSLPLSLSFFYKQVILHPLSSLFQTQYYSFVRLHTIFL